MEAERRSNVPKAMARTASRLAGQPSLEEEVMGAVTVVVTVVETVAVMDAVTVVVAVLEAVAVV